MLATLQQKKQQHVSKPMNADCQHVEQQQKPNQDTMSSVVSLLGEENALNDFKRIPTENKDKKPPAQGKPVLPWDPMHRTTTPVLRLTA